MARDSASYKVFANIGYGTAPIGDFLKVLLVWEGGLGDQTAYPIKPDKKVWYVMAATGRPSSHRF